MRTPVQVTAELHYQCGHKLTLPFPTTETATNERAHARFRICPTCNHAREVEKAKGRLDGVSDWTEEEIFFDRKRWHDARGNRIEIIEKKWLPEHNENATMHYRFRVIPK